MSLAAVFLDFGNTLLTERSSRAAIHADAARARGIAVDERAMAEHLSRAHAALPREMAGAFRYSDAWFRAFQRLVFVEHLGLPEDELPSLSRELFARFEDPRTFVLRPGARELLAALRERGLTLGLISNWSARLPRLLAALDLAKGFDFVLGSAAERAEKPEAELFRRALQRAGVTARSALHAGNDLERDVHGALSCGIAAVLVDHDRRYGPTERALCPTVESLPELRDLILERAA